VQAGSSGTISAEAAFSRFRRRINLDCQASFDLLEIFLVRFTAARKTDRPRVASAGHFQVPLQPPLGRAKSKSRPLMSLHSARCFKCSAIAFRARNIANIYMGFAAKERNQFNASTTGEAPGLSPTYGEFDNGALVFPRYADFRGSSLPEGWYSGQTPGGRGEVRIGNGVFIAHSGRGGGSAFLGSDWQVGSNIAEMDLLSQQTTRGQEMLFVCSSSPRYFHWTPDSVGYQDMSGLEIEDNNSGTPSVRATATPNPARSAVIGFHDGTIFANYQPVASVQTRICGGDYLATTVNSGFDASFSFDWIRMRVRPPNGVMPATIFGELNSGVTQTLSAEK